MKGKGTNSHKRRTDESVERCNDSYKDKVKERIASNNGLMTLNEPPLTTPNKQVIKTLRRKQEVIS